MSQRSTFGEFTPATHWAICRAIEGIIGTSKLHKCVLLDVGSGRGRLAMCVDSQIALRSIIGVEFDHNLHDFAQTNSLGTACVFAKGDFCEITSVRGANIILGTLTSSLCVTVCHCVACVCTVRTVCHCVCVTVCVSLSAPFVCVCAAFDKAFGDTTRHHVCRLFNESPDTILLMSCSKDLCKTAG